MGGASVANFNPFELFTNFIRGWESSGGVKERVSDARSGGQFIRSHLTLPVTYCGGHQEY